MGLGRTACAYVCMHVGSGREACVARRRAVTSSSTQHHAPGPGALAQLPPLPAGPPCAQEPPPARGIKHGVRQPLSGVLGLGRRAVRAQAASCACPCAACACKQAHGALPTLALVLFSSASRLTVSLVRNSVSYRSPEAMIATAPCCVAEGLLLIQNARVPWPCPPQELVQLNDRLCSECWRSPRDGLAGRQARPLCKASGFHSVSVYFVALVFMRIVAAIISLIASRSRRDPDMSARHARPPHLPWDSSHAQTPPQALHGCIISAGNYLSARIAVLCSTSCKCKLACWLQCSSCCAHQYPLNPLGMHKHSIKKHPSS